MDKRINLLNSIKERLNNLTNNNMIVEYNNKEYDRLKAIMINENILSGLEVNEKTFLRNEVYAESCQESKLCYHIYPIITAKPKLITKEFEFSDNYNKEKIIKVKV